MLKKLLLRLIEANNVLEGGRWLVLKGVKKGVVCWSWFEKKILQLCVAAYEKMRVLPRTSV